jgi:hypothetical protein
MRRSFGRDVSWIKYHAESLAELVDEEPVESSRFEQAVAERKAFDLWHDGYHQQAITKIEKLLLPSDSLDSQTRGWMEQLAGRISDMWGNRGRAEDFQRQAYAHNRNLIRPTARPPYVSLPVPGAQELAIVSQLRDYRLRRGFLQEFEDRVAYLNANSSANQFEAALADLGRMIGFSAEQHDDNGEGPDVLWLLPKKVGLVIEAKSRKKAKNALTKEEHGQLLVASEWFSKNYPGYTGVRVSVHPGNKATKAAVAGASHALTYECLGSLVSDARSLLQALCESQLSDTDLANECARLLSRSTIRADRVVQYYLLSFEVKS